MSLDETSKLTAPSLLDGRATGGIHAGDGFTVQERYVALLVPMWLADPAFERFQPERNEDVDVWFAGVRDHHQVKNEYLARGDVRALVGGFKDRNTRLLAEQRIRRFVIACPHLSDEMRGFANKLRILRTRHFDAGDEPERAASMATLRQTAEKLGFGDVFEFLVDHVYFEQAIVGLDTESNDARELLSVRLAQFVGTTVFTEGKALANALLAALADNRRRAWSRAELLALLDHARREHREGPSRPAGDLLLVRHVTLKRVDRDPRREDNTDLFGERRAIVVDLDGVDRMRVVDEPLIDALAHELATSDRPYLRALNRPDAEVLYYGFPHVPFGVLAGYIAQPHRRVALVEHDLDTGRFEWRPDAPTSPAKVTVSERGGGAAAQVRISVSAHVREDVCAAALPPNELAVDISIEAAEVGRGTVATEAQAREHAARLRRALDQRVNGNAGITSVHLFAAVPVSVAFRIGQVLANTGLPRCYVYNFDASATPQYHWRLDLLEATRGARCAELLGRK
jgi:hypothetical protein